MDPSLRRLPSPTGNTAHSGGPLLRRLKRSKCTFCPVTNTYSRPSCITLATLWRPHPFMESGDSFCGTCRQRTRTGSPTR